MQAPGGAILEFDEPFDLKRAKIGKLVGGQLDGQITITSTRASGRDGNELRIVTRDVDMADDRIWTPATRSTFGSAQITAAAANGNQLAKDDGPSKKRNTGIGELRTFQLAHNVKMHMQMGAKELLPDAAPRPPSELAKVEPPVEVTCAGVRHAAAGCASGVDGRGVERVGAVDDELLRGPTSLPISISKVRLGDQPVVDGHPAQRPVPRAHRRLGQLVGVHLAEPLVALRLLEAQALLGQLGGLALVLRVGVGVDVLRPALARRWSARTGAAAARR